MARRWQGRRLAAPRHDQPQPLLLPIRRYWAIVPTQQTLRLARALNPAARGFKLSDKVLCPYVRGRLPSGQVVETLLEPQVRAGEPAGC
jgi:hypothetical protein